MEWLKTFENYGPVWLVLVLILAAVWKMIIWLMAFIKEDRAQQAIEREKWLCRLEKLDDSIEKTATSIDKTTASIDNHDKRADERGNHVRLEHEKMIANLEEQGKTLLRINGYKAP